MDNSISKNLECSNSIDSLCFTWKAFFSDGSMIEQYENDNEHRFQEVKDRFDDLVRFSLVNKDYSKCFTVDLKNSFIIYNNYNISNLEIIKRNNCRLIFFRRHKVELTEKLEQSKHEIIYFLGFQYNVEYKKNRKILLQIDNLGNFIIGD